MTDKAACRARLAAAGVPIPAGDVAPSTAEALRAWLDERRVRAAFVKARWGSSGAGVFAMRRRPGQEVVWSSMRATAAGLEQRKRVQRVDDGAEIDALLGPVLADGAVVEVWVPKQGVGDLSFDLRVVVIDGAPALRVARAARGPITNLHLDAVRIDPAELLSAATLARVDALAVQVAAVFPGHRCFGVDVLVDPRGGVYVCEVNAWGDNVRGVSVDGRSVWDLQIDALLRAPAAA